MKQFYKNIIDLNFYNPDPLERRKDIIKEIINHSDYLPKTLKYEDIDISFKEWVENSINIVLDDVKLPTIVLYSNQRFSEYLQSWRYTDENNNIRLNFKAVTRENNPSHGTILGETYNIPGNRFYTFKSVPAVDESGKKYRIDYKMKQPTPVDFIYKVSVMTNKYTIINEFNEMVNRIFNAKQSYISPNGHYMPIILESINDESEYNIEDRQFFSQSFSAKVKGYILTEDDFKIEENPVASIICFEGDNKKNKSTVELSEYDGCYVEEGKYYNKPIDIDIDFSFIYPCNGKAKFVIDEDFVLTNIKFKDNNILTNEISLIVNDELITENLLKNAFEGYSICEEIPSDSNNNNTLHSDLLPKEKNILYKYIFFNNNYYKWHRIEFKDGDEIIVKTKRNNRQILNGGITLIGYNRFVVYPTNPVESETLFDKKEYNKEIININTECN